tara:strand:- start:944 stop:1360 length:417 start_codon:yes stop_codon:yes gene_type:complete
MERTIGIISVVHVYVSRMMVIVSVAVVINIHATKPMNPSSGIADINITDLGNTTVIIVVNRHILNLNNGTVIVVLGIWAIIIARIKSDAIPAPLNAIFYVKVEFPIRKNRKGNAILYENEGVVVSISIAFCNLIIFNT